MSDSSSTGDGLGDASTPSADLQTNSSAASDNDSAANSLFQSAYVDFSTGALPSAAVNLCFKNGTLNLAAGSDADNGLYLGATELAVMQATYKIGAYTFGIMPSPMGVENSGPGNPFLAYSDVFQNLHNAEAGIAYRVNDKVTLGLTRDTTTGQLKVPDDLEITYSQPIGKYVTAFLGADIGPGDHTFNENLTYKNGKASVAGDALETNSGNFECLEGTYQINKDLSVAGRIQSTDKDDVAATWSGPRKHLFVKGQDEVVDGNNKVTFGIGWQFGSQ